MNFFYLFIVVYLIYLVVEWGLEWLNLNYLKKNAAQIPSAFLAYIIPEQYQKSIAYTRAKTYFGLGKNFLDLIIFWILLLSGAFYQIHLYLAQYVNGIHLSVAYLLSLGALSYLLGLPFQYYHQFHLEDRFGFNKMTRLLFITDQLKSMLIALAIGTPLLYLMFWILNSLGNKWWLWAWATMLLVQVLLAALFPILLMPLFYKFTPLADGELKDQIVAIAKKINFKMSGVFTIDGSKRSGHSNAFFAGIGKTRRIVLYDTLVNSLNTEELVGVLAHEMGHNIKKHVLKSLLVSALTTLFGFYLLAQALNWPVFYQSFFIPEAIPHIGIILFTFLFSVFTFPLTPLFQALSRKHEYEADAFAIAHTAQPQALAHALIKLSKDNLSNLTPHPWYSFYHYSHPTTLERISIILPK